MMLVEIFKSPRKPDTYLYLERGADVDKLPEALRQVFGVPELVMSLKLTEDRKLARYSGARVLEAIAAEGYFLQLPPEKSSAGALDEAFGSPQAIHSEGDGTC